MTWHTELRELTADINAGADQRRAVREDGLGPVMADAAVDHLERLHGFSRGHLAQMLDSAPTWRERLATARTLCEGQQPCPGQ